MILPKSIPAIVGLWAVVFVTLLSLFFVKISLGQEDTGQSEESDQAVIVVAGAEGSSEYKEKFESWAEAWKTSASHTQLTVIGLGDDKGASKKQLQDAIEKFAQDSQLQEVWLVLIGHGTFDGKRAKFNLQGPDVEADELKVWLKPVKARIVILNCTSSSSPFINALSGDSRIIVTATRDGFEYNFARFGYYLSRSVDDRAIDLDKDGQTSVLEAFLAASRGAADFYQQENRIATEHALLDDNGDAQGTPADWFEGVRANRRPKSGMPDGLLANQVFLNRRGVENLLSPEARKMRDQLEAELETIRLLKGKMDESEFLLKIEPVLIRLAELYEQPKDKIESK